MIVFNVVPTLDRYLGKVIIIRYGTGDDLRMVLKEYDVYPNEKLGMVASFTVVGSASMTVFNILLASAGFKGDADNQVLYGRETNLNTEVSLIFPRRFLRL